jgi:cytoskeletal protein CcmA (bactofilin family)
MAEIHASGSLLVGEGVFMKGTMQVPGVASIDGKLEGQLSADSVFIQQNGSMDGQTTANHVRVAGTLTDTTVANRTLLVEATGLVAGSITYQELEIKKGGSLQGGIYKVGREAPAVPARAPEPPRVAAPEPVVTPEPQPAYPQRRLLCRRAPSHLPPTTSPKTSDLFRAVCRPALRAHHRVQGLAVMMQDHTS